MKWLEEKSKGLFHLHVFTQPRASKTECVGLHDGDQYLKIRVTSPPVEGEANAELIRFLKKFFKGDLSAIAMISGDTSRKKTIALEFADGNVDLNKVSEKLLVSSRAKG